MLCVILVVLYILALAACDKTIQVTNNCQDVVSVGVLTNGGGSSDQTFDLTPKASRSVSKPDTWGGRVWGRHQCSGSSSKDAQQCGNPGATNPASLAEFFFKGAFGKDFYDISLVDGYNLPMSISPVSQGTGGYNCGSPKCDTMPSCPQEYAVKDATGNVVACQSACSKTNTAAACCTGANDDPSKCTPGDHSNNIKKACPDAYSFAYDDQTSTFECNSETYTVTFC
ncbi:hypothetical protein DFQ28_010151 [Apophysomyces sp. BC1034]|nr:hypothetical protein DFQ30_009776 [Apophysomyces sp. BC1015]KAG0171935.1 hypothetical protein DFQ29_008633 [Apophysomyces sp. BC1021]KAG0184978.1 hypothetical protein DFQ28_010151 [Apophysomyces sp. BC1034]